MNSVAVQQKRFIKITPSNNASGGFSPDGAQPIIRFSVADTMASADMSQARVNFKLRVSDDGANAVAPTNDFNVDKGVNGCAVIDQVIVSSRRYGNQIEAVHNLGRLNSSWYTSLYSPKQMATNVNMNCRSIGKGNYSLKNNSLGLGALVNDPASILQRKYLVTNNTTTAQGAVVAQRNWNQGTGVVAGAGSLSTADATSAGYLDFSIPLHLGFFQSSDVNLNQVGGLEIVLYLDQSRNLFYGAGVASTSTYSITDVSLTIPLLYYNSQQIAAQAQQQQSVLSFMYWTSVYSVLDSTFNSIAHRLSLKGLLSAIHNLQPTITINNTNNDNHALYNPGIRVLTFLRDGVKNPYEKSMIPNENRALALANKSCTYAEILNEYLSAYRNPRDINYTQVIPENLVGRGSVVEGVFGLGQNYDPSAGAGVDINGTISYDIESKLEDVSTPNAAQTEPYAFYSYYLSRQDYIVSPQGMSSV
tara:strand:+ start:1820 stop:3244 length:1425 start_codon:yes stop_codon:yes gene_type:complete